MKSRNRVLYYGKKAAAFLASVLLLSVLVFYISRLAPGDPLVSYYGDRVEKMRPKKERVGRLINRHHTVCMEIGNLTISMNTSIGTARSIDIDIFSSHL